jgi:enoyl-[acyl-carrier protein] reductase I
VGDARTVFKWNKAHAPLKRTVELNHVGGAALYLLSDLAGGVTGEIHFVDSGFNVIGMPPTADLNGWTPTENGHEGGPDKNGQEHPDGRADT